MRKVNPKGLDTPIEIKDSKIKNQVIDILNPSNKPSDTVYKGTITIRKKALNKVSLALRKKYKSKCGYCETYESDPQVEHHRPKGFVTYGVGFPKLEENNGYHWLAYEWTNMIAACARCNSRKYKGTKFPVLVKGEKRKLILANRTKPNFPDDYRYKSKYLQNEKPQLLHPEYCLPSAHFSFNRNGEIIGKTAKGIESINVYGLNDTTTITNRLEVFNRFNERIFILLKKRWRKVNQKDRAYLKEEIGDVYFDILNRAKNSEKSYTMFNKDLYTRFEYYYIDTISSTKAKQEMLDIFKEILIQKK